MAPMRHVGAGATAVSCVLTSVRVCALGSLCVPVEVTRVLLCVRPLALCLSWSRWWLWRASSAARVWPTHLLLVLGVSMAEAQGACDTVGEESGEMGQGVRGWGRGGAGTGTLKQVCG